MHKMHTQFTYRVFMCGNNLGQVLFPMIFFTARLKLVSIHKTCMSKIYLYSGMPHWRQTHYEHKIPPGRRVPAFHTAFIPLSIKISLRPLDITEINRSSFPEIKGQTRIIIFFLLITDLKLMYFGGKNKAHWEIQWSIKCIFNNHLEIIWAVSFSKLLELERLML